MSITAKDLESIGAIDKRLLNFPGEMWDYFGYELLLQNHYKCKIISVSFVAEDGKIFRSDPMMSINEETTIDHVKEYIEMSVLALKIIKEGK